MPMLTSQILRSVYFTESQKSKSLENETFFLQIKKFIKMHQGLLYGKNSFLGNVRFQTFEHYFVSGVLSIHYLNELISNFR